MNLNICLHRKPKAIVKYNLNLCKLMEERMSIPQIMKNVCMLCSAIQDLEQLEREKLYKNFSVREYQMDLKNNNKKLY